jgi:hypothetical protein
MLRAFGMFYIRPPKFHRLFLTFVQKGKPCCAEKKRNPKCGGLGSHLSQTSRLLETNRTLPNCIVLEMFCIAFPTTRLWSATASSDLRTNKPEAKRCGTVVTSNARVASEIPATKRFSYATPPHGVIVPSDISVERGTVSFDGCHCYFLLPVSMILQPHGIARCEKVEIAQ